MCGRASISLKEKELEDKFNATFYSDEIKKYTQLPNYNVAPTNVLPIIKMEDKAHFSPYRWGLIPSWAKTEKIGFKMINARVETLLSKSAFKASVKRRRCLVPLTSYYEWIQRNGRKIPFRIFSDTISVFPVAGIYDEWNKGGETIHSFSIITRPAATNIEKIHDRMPAILEKELASEWISDNISVDQLVEEIKHPEIKLNYHEVSAKVNNVRNNGPELIEEVDSGTEGEQLSLF